jgi:hypothetical protein
MRECILRVLRCRERGKNERGVGDSCLVGLLPLRAVMRLLWCWWLKLLMQSAISSSGGAGVVRS